MKREIKRVAEVLKRARRLLFVTGAGVSAESGIPTFRGSTAAFREGLTDEGIPFEQALSGPSFQQYPELSWRYFFQLERSLRGRTPNGAHHAIAGFERRGWEVCVATQNIDGLHQAAGSNAVLELHGNLFRIVCTKCDYQSRDASFDTLPALPLCPRCGGILRPDIVLYEEALPGEAMERFFEEQAQGFDLVFSVGTTSVFSYVVEPVLRAAHRGVPTVEINPEETPLSTIVGFRFSGRAGDVLQALFAELPEEGRPADPLS